MSLTTCKALTKKIMYNSNNRSSNKLITKPSTKWVKDRDLFDQTN